MLPRWEDGFLLRWGPLWVAFVDSATIVIWDQTEWCKLPSVRRR